MDLTIKTNINLFYRQLLEILSSFSPVNKLRQGEIRVLAEIMKQNFNYKNLSKTARRNVIFSKEVKEEMCDNLKISRDSLNTNLSVLRKKNILNNDNTLIKGLEIFPSKSFDFKVTFKFE